MGIAVKFGITFIKTLSLIVQLEEVVVVIKYCVVTDGLARTVSQLVHERPLEGVHKILSLCEMKSVSDWPAHNVSTRGDTCKRGKGYTVMDLRRLSLQPLISMPDNLIR